MKRLLPATALALAVGLAALPAWAQTSPSEGGRGQSAPPSTQRGPDGGRHSGAPPSRELRPDDDGRRSERPGAETQRCVSNFRTLDKNADGMLTAKELDRFERVVKDVDTNKDGKISSAEYQSACASGILRDRDIKS
jgi:hypothetical protein